MKQQYPVVGVVAQSQDERTRPLLDVLVPRTAYGNDAAIDFAQFGQTAILEGKLFTAEFAKRVYDSVWKSSTLRSDRQNLSNNPELCLWLKSQIESLDIKNQDEITSFLKTFDTRVKELPKNSDLNHQQFVSTLQYIQKMLRLFIRARLPELALPLDPDDAEAVSVVSATLTDVLGAARRANAYLTTALPVHNAHLFSAAFVKLIYEQMIIASQYLNQTVLFKSEICAAIKAKIESAKTKDAVIDLFEFLNASIDAEEQWYSADSVFVKTLKDIRNQIGRYVAIVHPHIPEQINAELVAVNAERNNALRESVLYGAWSTLCAVNALGQSWTNVLWTASNAALCIPLMFFSTCFPALFRSSGDDCDCPGLFFPFECDAMSDYPKLETPPVLVPIASTVKGCANMWSEGSKALEHHRKLRSHQQVAETCSMR